MDIFSLFTLCGGIAFFLYGMSLMSSRLEKLAGGRRGFPECWCGSPRQEVHRWLYQSLYQPSLG